MKKWIAAFAFACVASLTNAYAETEAQKAMAATQAACDAFRQQDLAAVEQLLAPEFVLVTSRAEVQTREQVIAEIRAGDPKYSRFENHSMSARVYGDTAVVQGITSIEGASGGSAFKVDVRFTDTLIKVKGRWTLVVSHVTRIPS
jgi:ketosteroid isomerase-like protein